MLEIILKTLEATDTFLNIGILFGAVIIFVSCIRLYNHSNAPGLKIIYYSLWMLVIGLILFLIAKMATHTNADFFINTIFAVYWKLSFIGLTTGFLIYSNFIKSKNIEAVSSENKE
ncbi:hypothetical protein KCU40_004282 [Vibrio vulnificus]|nr:hypothetical protein [Vibrio vulnificus]